MWKNHPSVYFYGKDLIEKYYKKAKKLNKEEKFYNILYTKQLTPNLLKKYLKDLLQQ